jgi:hypothetical protein|tara:strand:- start:385 stop:822 length:438 start_codon:yes stop_codon:yes gene_type:complete
MMKQNEEMTLTAPQEKYLDWLCTAPSERVPASKNKYSMENAVDISTMRRWEKKDIFRSRWKTQVDDIQGSPERTQKLLDNLYNKALEGDTKSAELYLKATNRMAPPSVTISSNKKTVDLTDAELDSLIATIAEREKAGRVKLRAV